MSINWVGMSQFQCEDFGEKVCGIKEFLLLNFNQAFPFLFNSIEISKLIHGTSAEGNKLSFTNRAW